MSNKTEFINLYESAYMYVNCYLIESVEGEVSIEELEDHFTVRHPRTEDKDILEKIIDILPLAQNVSIEDGVLKGMELKETLKARLKAEREAQEAEAQEDE